MEAAASAVEEGLGRRGEERASPRGFGRSGWSGRQWSVGSGLGRGMKKRRGHTGSDLEVK